MTSGQLLVQGTFHGRRAGDGDDTCRSRLGRPERLLAAGAAADLVVLEAETTTDILRGVAPRRTTIKGGKLVGGTNTERWVGRDEASPA